MAIVGILVVGIINIVTNGDYWIGDAAFTHD